MLLHSTFVRPFLRYSIMSRSQPSSPSKKMLIDIPVPGMTSAKLLHDFGVSGKHTVIIEPPLSLDPLNLAYNKPVVSYEPKGRTRFGVFPRWDPQKIIWVATDACCIFHTANTWDGTFKEWPTVNMLVCRMISASIVYNLGNISLPTSEDQTSEECRLYYYQFITDGPCRGISQQWALSAIPFEFPHVPKHLSMSSTQFVYGCSMVHGSFGEQLGKAAKIDCLVKMDVQQLISRGLSNPPPSVSGCVDERSIAEVLASSNSNEVIHIFQMPKNWYAQECAFVPRADGIAEDDGWLLTFVFDESQLDSEGTASDDAVSELWIIDAKEMKNIVCRILLPQRVPYGLHGGWFTKDEISQQRRVDRFRF
jgi:carotenoid cleavage dioxygenase-like enzyme